MAKEKTKKHQGLYVKVKNNDVEYALKLLKRKIKEANLFLDIQKHESFTKPSAIRRDKKSRSKLRAKHSI